MAVRSGAALSYGAAEVFYNGSLGLVAAQNFAQVASGPGRVLALPAAARSGLRRCVKEPSVDNFREAMHGDAARTAALLLMIACSTDAPAVIRCPG